MWREIGIVVALVLCMLVIRRLSRRHGDDSRSAKLMAKYKILTPELLADTADEELVEAVVAHVLAQAAESRKPDPVYTLSKLPQPFMVVYSIWAVCKEMAHGSYAALTRTATREVVEHACDGLPVVGAPETAAALTALVQAHKEGEDTTALEQAFHQAVETECPLALCAAYVRDHVPALTGTKEEPAAPETALPEDTTHGE